MTPPRQHLNLQPTTPIVALPHPGQMPVPQTSEHSRYSTVEPTAPTAFSPTGQDRPVPTTATGPAAASARAASRLRPSGNTLYPCRRPPTTRPPTPLLTASAMRGSTALRLSRGSLSWRATVPSAPVSGPALLLAAPLNDDDDEAPPPAEGTDGIALRDGRWADHRRPHVTCGPRGISERPRLTDRPLNSRPVHCHLRRILGRNRSFSCAALAEGLGASLVKAGAGLFCCAALAEDWEPSWSRPEPVVLLCCSRRGDWEPSWSRPEPVVLLALAEGLGAFLVKAGAGLFCLAEGIGCLLSRPEPAPESVLPSPCKRLAGGGTWLPEAQHHFRGHLENYRQLRGRA